MASTPVTTFQLFAVPWDIDYNNVIDFTDDAQRKAYFNTLPHSAKYTLAQYIRRDSLYNVPVLFDAVEQYNYIVYNNNEGLGDEYAFIVNKRFLSFEATELSLKLDVWQTHLFDYNIPQAFIERRHKDRYTSAGVPIFSLATDVEYKPTVVSLKKKCFSKFQTRDVVYLGLVVNEGGVFSGVNIFQKGQCVKILYLPVSIADVDYRFTLTELPLNPQLTTLGELSLCLGDPRVLAVFLTPYPPFRENRVDMVSVQSVTLNRDSASDPFEIKGIAGFIDYVDPDNINEGTISLGANIILRGDIDVNNLSISNERNIAFEPMLLNKPYHFYRVVQCGGESFDVEPYELNGTNLTDLVYKVSGGVYGCVCMVRANDNTLKTDLKGQFHKVVSEGAPLLTLRTDPYLNYVLNNSASMNGGLITSIALAGAGIGVAAATGGTSLLVTAAAASAGISQVGNVAGEMMKRADLKDAPDTIRSVGADLLAEFANENYGGVVKVWEYSLPDIDKKRLFDYFTKYGYKCSTVEPLTLRTRYYYDYIKTIGATELNITCTNERQAFENIFNKGVTVWHCNGGAVNIGDYSKENVERSLM